jgi:hypothetical protein
MDFIKKIFETRETNLILSELENLNYYFESDSIHSLEFMYAWEYVYKQTKSNIFKNSKILTKEVKEKVSTPKIIVLNLIAKLTSIQVSSGNHHIYRGILNPTGKELKNIFYKVMNNLKELKAYNEEEIKSFKEELEENIKIVG